MTSITNNSISFTSKVNPLTGYASPPQPDTTPLQDPRAYGPLSPADEIDCLLIEMRQAGVITFRETDIARCLFDNQLNGARSAAERCAVVDHWVAQLAAFRQFGVR